jgi:hypothetical protein
MIQHSKGSAREELNLGDALGDRHNKPGRKGVDGKQEQETYGGQK